MPSGHITDWNPDRKFGYVESEGRRIFLHARDFSKRYKTPEVGDNLTFAIGKDRQGRTCAQKAVHINEGGRVTSENILFLILLLGAPTFALVRLSRVVPSGYLAGYGLGISLVTYAVYAWDKARARTKKQREPEAELHFLELIGGWPGAFVAQRRLRHKCTKLIYQIVFWLIVALHQFVAADYLRDWTTTRHATQALERAMSVK